MCIDTIFMVQTKRYGGGAGSFYAATLRPILHPKPTPAEQQQARLPL
jgi:hypothetical protein